MVRNTKQHCQSLQKHFHSSGCYVLHEWTNINESKPKLSIYQD